MKAKHIKEYNLEALDYCTKVLSNGGIGIFPTDTVYGIGCDCLNTISLNNLYKIKKRELNKPMCILVSNIEMINTYVTNISKLEKKIIQNFWPGPLTIIFKKSNLIPDELNSGLSTIGIRMPNNKICLDLINKLGRPIATSSANISNELPEFSITTALLNNFKNNVDFILDAGKLDKVSPSTIIIVENDTVKLLREGPISLKDIMEVIENDK